MIETVEGAADYLEGLINLEMRPELGYDRLGLAAIRSLLDRLARPDRGLRVIHIAGSKGKGSTALLAESLLRAAGLRVGTFTSPHLERWTERFRIDGCEVEGPRLAAAVERLRPHVDALRGAEHGAVPSFFDATTATALWLFAEAEVDCAILEVGLGGRLDSTNAVQPAVACVTGIELEHTDKLGDTRAAIAREKAGILKPGVPAVVGDLPEDAARVVAARAGELDVPVAWLGRDFSVEVREMGPEGLGLRLVDGAVVVDARVPVLGRHQAHNAALALACARRCGALTDAQLGRHGAVGLAAARLPGRIERLGRDPWILVDAAHTAASARALARVLADIRRRRTQLVLSVSAGKDLAALLMALLPEASEVTVTRAEAARSQAPEEIAAAIRARAPGLSLRVVPNPHLAVRAVRGTSFGVAAR
jgi:dihydrofolate synthase/folylpolyglutamate synthase